MDTENTHRMVELEAFNVVGLEEVCEPATDVDPAGNRSLQTLWDRFFTRWEEIPNMVDFYGVCLPREDGKPGFRYIASVKVSGEPEVPEGMVCARVPALKYAVFGFNDVVANMPARFGEIFGKLLPAAGLTPHSSHTCLEFYPHDCYDEATGKIRSDLHIAVN